MQHLSNQGIFMLLFFGTLIGGGLAADVGWDTAKVCFWVVSFWSFVGMYATKEENQD